MIPILENVADPQQLALQPLTAHSQQTNLLLVLDLDVIGEANAAVNTAKICPLAIIQPIAANTAFAKVQTVNSSTKSTLLP